MSKKLVSILLLSLLICNANSRYVNQCTHTDNDACGPDFVSNLECKESQREIGTQQYFEGFNGQLNSKGQIPVGWYALNTGTVVGGSSDYQIWKVWNLEEWADGGDSLTSQDRSSFQPGACANGIVADGDNYNHNTSGKKLNTVIQTVDFQVSGAANTLFLIFDQAWKPSNSEQTAKIEVTYDQTQTWTTIYELSSNESDKETYMGDSLEDTIMVALNNPKGTSTIMLQFTYSDPNNGWYWAVSRVGIFQYNCPEGFSPAGAGSLDCVEAVVEEVKEVDTSELERYTQEEYDAKLASEQNGVQEQPRGSAVSECYAGKFFDGDACVACAHKCKECDNGQDCISCKDGNRKAPDCNCPEGQYDNNGVCTQALLCSQVSFENYNDDSCLHCKLYCADCSSAVNMSADPNQQLPSGCAKFCGDCTPKQEEEVACAHCPYKCNDCDTECETCADVNREAPDCLCKDGTYDVEGVVCRNCRPECKLCKEHSTCTECIPGEHRDLPYCYCNKGYYEDPSTKECVKCPNGCLECTSATNCTQCTQLYFRVIPTCECREGYYENEEGVCVECDYSCGTCETSSDNCITCRDPTRDPSKCECPDPMYSNKWGTECLPCREPCASCQEQTSCKTCKDTTSGRSGPPECLCPDGTWDDNGEDCKECKKECATCNCDYVCETCKDKERDPPNCKCNPIGEWDDNGEECRECQPRCLTCSNDTQCIQCKDETRKSPDCKCYIGTYEVSPYKCEECKEECKSCTNGDTCTECKESSRKLPYCECREGYYDNGVTCVPMQECSKIEFHDKLDPTLCTECDITCQVCPEDHSSKCKPECSGICTQNDLNNDPTCAALGCKVNCHNCGEEQFCEDCMSVCKSCKNETSCVECKDSVNRSPPDCQCSQGFYSIDDENCGQCAPNCTACTGNQENDCTECKDGFVLAEGKCVLQAFIEVESNKQQHLDKNHNSRKFH